MNSTECVFCTNNGTISVSYSGRAPDWFCKGCYEGMYLPRIKDKIGKINGQLEDLQVERREKTQMFISHVQGIITNPSISKSITSRYMRVALKSFLDTWESLEKDQDEERDFLLRKLAVLTKERDDAFEYNCLVSS